MIGTISRGIAASKEPQASEEAGASTDEPCRTGRRAGPAPRDRRPGASPGPGEALVRVAWAGVCGSDRDLLEGTRPAPFVRYPIVPGHEWSGTVAGVGDGVDRALTGPPIPTCSTRSPATVPSCSSPRG
ncbi:MAG: alcohol dehydrogenase catalytic domain-containing protein [Streptosporangiales bacterium]|nr:alcohol dehydrogenase catalytic domain-containing protein [Streptosporangiales bacterium]